MTHRRLLDRIGPVAVLTAVLLVGPLSAGSAEAATLTKRVTIVASSSTCPSAFCFKPSKASVAPSTKVTWTNATSAMHTVTRCTVAVCGVSGGTGTDQGFGSPVLNPRGSYSFTFRGAGTYRYYCQIHGFAVMNGTITVT